MAAARALGIPELLEAILLEVDDMKTLLLAQRVNRTWNAVIVASNAMQETLFFRRSMTGPVRHNDMLLSRFHSMRPYAVVMQLRVPLAATLLSTYPLCSSANSMYLVTTKLRIEYQALMDEPHICICNFIKGRQAVEVDMFSARATGTLGEVRWKVAGNRSWGYDHLEGCKRY